MAQLVEHSIFLQEVHRQFTALVPRDHRVSLSHQLKKKCKKVKKKPDYFVFRSLFTCLLKDPIPWVDNLLRPWAAWSPAISLRAASSQRKITQNFSYIWQSYLLLVLAPGLTKRNTRAAGYRPLSYRPTIPVLDWQTRYDGSCQLVSQVSCQSDQSVQAYIRGY